MTGDERSVQALLHGPISVVNIGLEMFTGVLLDQGVPGVQVDWTPPASGDARLMAILEKLGS